MHEDLDITNNSMKSIRFQLEIAFRCDFADVVEVKSGERNESNFPVQYLGANVPQAWAAGSVFMLTQALLGFLPDAPRNKLYVDPSLPAWLPDLTVRDLRIGKHKLDIRFSREGEKTAFDVIKGDPQLVERCNIASKITELRTASGLSQSNQPPVGRSNKRESGARTVDRARSRTLS